MLYFSLLNNTNYFYFTFLSTWFYDVFYFNNGLFNVASNKNYGPDRNEEHIQSAADGSLDPAAGGYDIKMVDNAILFSLGLLF